MDPQYDPVHVCIQVMPAGAPTAAEYFKTLAESHGRPGDVGDNFCYRVPLYDAGATDEEIAAGTAPIRMYIENGMAYRYIAEAAVFMGFMETP
jgi:hypothetical protein